MTRRRVLWAALGLGLLALLRLQVASWLDGADALPGVGGDGQALFAAAYVLAALFGLPAAPLSVSAGAVWGAGQGALLVWASATLAAQVTFHVSRRFRTAWRSWLVRAPGGEAIEAVLGSVEDLSTVVLLRLSPVFPYNLLNVAMGLSRVSAWTHLAGTAVGMVPGVALYVSAGAALGELADGDARPSMSPMVMALAVLVTALAVRIVGRRAAVRLATRGVVHG